MTRLTRRAGVAVVAAIGLAGLGLAHVLEYLALVPDGHRRAYVLAATGHQYLPSALSAAGFLGTVAVVVAFLSGFRAGARRRETSSAAEWARLLPVAQALAFVAVEVAERLAAGASLADLGPVLVLGLPLQVLAGIVGGRLLLALARAGERLGRLVSGRSPLVGRRRTGPCWRPLDDAPLPSLFAGRSAPARGPPRLLALA